MKQWNENARSDGGNQISFYGMDVYSLHSSAEAVIKYLEEVDPKAATLARSRYGCFERFGHDTQAYAFTIRYGLAKGCEAEAVRVLKDLLAKSGEYLRKTAAAADEAQFLAEMNALVVRDAEEYYRKMLRSVSGLGLSGEVNVGQLCREKFGMDHVYNIGFLTFKGTVTAAHEWDTPAVLMKVNPGRDDSYEGVLEREGPTDNFMLITKKIDRDRKKEVNEGLNRYLNIPMRLERFIGVIYRPMTERWSHYSKAALADQFDAICHIHETRGIRPLDKSAHFPDEEENVPEMFPFGL
ncbi:hypothetical protein HK102_004216 [Quaeritorhiza haematococci]|nr:hypothetical protein HK102_004216 [Quaeritorhiza haematococci]